MNDSVVLVITLHADPSAPSGVGEGGGTHAYVRELAAGLASRGRQCVVVTRRSSPQHEPELVISPLTKLFRIDIGPPGPLDKRELNGLHDATVAAIEDVIARMERPPSVLHSVYWNSGRAAMDLAGRIGAPYVHTVISNGKGRRLRGAAGQASQREAVEHAVYHGAYRIFSIASAEKRDLVELYGVPEEKIRVIGRPVAPCYLQPAHDELGNPRPLVLEGGGLMDVTP